MTETINKPKRGRGRPKKYFTDEDRKQADKRCMGIKEGMERNPFYCLFCNHTYHMASKSKHIKSKKHRRNIEKKTS